MHRFGFLHLSVLQITHPRVLLLGGGVILFFLWKRWRHTHTPLVFQYATLMPHDPLAKRLVGLSRFRLLLLLGVAFFVLSGPRWIETKEHISKNGIDIVLALDISYSMEANDLSPTRLEAAKQALEVFLGTRVSDRVGMIVFAGKPFISVPLTFDYTIFREILQRTQTDTIDQGYVHLQGTAVGDALLSSITLLEKEQIGSGTREQIIVLFTDGTANVGVDPRIVAEMAATKQIKIYTIGLGSIEGGTIVTQTAFGTREQRVDGIDEVSLSDIAEITQGRYARAVDASSLDDIVGQIATLTKTEQIVAQYHQSRDARKPFVIFLVFGMIVWLWLDRKTRGVI